MGYRFSGLEGKVKGNYYNGVYRDHYKGFLHHSYLTKGQFGGASSSFQRPCLPNTVPVLDS